MKLLSALRRPEVIKNPIARPKKLTDTLRHRSLAFRALLTAIFALMASVFAFRPYDQEHGNFLSFPYGPLYGRLNPTDQTHESVTRMALRTLYVDFFEIKESSYSSQVRSAVKEIVDANARVDSVYTGSASDAPSHFDGESILTGHERLKSLRRRIVSHLHQDEAPRARETLGQALHTLQDFYSHSNWIEMGRKGANPDLGQDNATASANLIRLLAPIDAPTCQDCAVPLFNCTNKVTTAYLTSGYFEPVRIIAVDKPTNRCSHGGPLDVASQDRPVGGINKDTSSVLESPNAPLHLDAASAALEATVQYICSLTNQITIDELKLLFGINDGEKLELENYGPSPKEFFVAIDSIGLGEVRVPAFSTAAVQLPALALIGDHRLNIWTYSLDDLERWDFIIRLPPRFRFASVWEVGLDTSPKEIPKTREYVESFFKFPSPMRSHIDSVYTITADVGWLTGLTASAISVNSSPVSLLSVSDSSGGQLKSYTLPVDSTLEEVTFSQSGASQFIITRPDGQAVKAADAGVQYFTSNEGAVYRINQPGVGAWKVEVNGTGATRVYVTGRSKLDLQDFRFVQLTGRAGHQGYFRLPGEPIAAQTNFVLATMNGNVQTAEFEFRSLTGEVIKDLDLARGNDSITNEFGGSVVPPPGPFAIYVTGLDATGQRYQRMLAGQREAQTVVVIPPGPEDLEPGTTNTLTFEVVNLGAPGTFSISVSDDRGYATNVMPASITLGSNQTNEVKVKVVVPLNAAVGTGNSIVLRVKASSSSGSGNYAVVSTGIFERPADVLPPDEPGTQDRPPDLIWARSGGGPKGGSGHPHDKVNGVAPDGKGGAYVTGIFSEYARFGGLEMRSSDTSGQFFLVKYDENGRPVWERHGTNSQSASGDQVVATPDGGVVVAGACVAPATIDGVAVEPGGPYELSWWPRSLTTWCYFIAKYDANGNRLWIRFAKRYPLGYGIGPQLAIDPAGNVFLTGTFYQVVDFESEVLMNPDLTGIDPQWNGSFVAKYSPSGELKWVKQITELPLSAVAADSPAGLQVDAEGNLYLSGGFYGNAGDEVKIGGLASASPRYVAKLDSTGVGLWIKSLQGYAGNIVINGAGEVYSASPSLSDAVPSTLSKFDPYGRQLWRKDLRGVYRLILSPDSQGGVITVSRVLETSFEAITGQPVADNIVDGFGTAIIAFKRSGEIQWAHYIAGGWGAIYCPLVLSVVQDSANSVFMAGNYNTYTLLDGVRLRSPWSSTEYLGYTVNDAETFVAKYSHPKAAALPLITIHPGSIETFEGTPAELRVAASSRSPMTYQWLFNGQPISFAVNPKLSITNASAEMSGRFSALVSNLNGRAESEIAMVSVIPMTKVGQVLNSTNLEWRAGGLRNWELETNVTHDGVQGLRTPYLYLDYPMREECWLETTLQGPGVISFWWKSSTASHVYADGVDALEFSLDGIKQYQIYGLTDWEARTVTVGEGSHNVRWRWALTKPPGLENLCWLDQVTFQPAGAGLVRITGANRLSDGKFEFTVSGPAGAMYGIEACSDLKTWLPISQVRSTNETLTFTHRNANNYKVHYYRAVVLTP